jgi:DNA-binding NarL/FixJ family response regulator
MMTQPPTGSLPSKRPELPLEHRGNVLIADDDVLVSKPLAKVLTARGYDVTCVENGWDAGKALATGRYDLLVTDILMPGNTTLDVLRTEEVRALRIPVIVITGHPTVETAINALRLSVVDYFVKPIDPEAFLEGVSRAVARRRALHTVSEIEERVGAMSAVLESVRSTLDMAGTPLIALDRDAPNDDERAIRARLQSGDFSSLSPREREVLVLIAKGASTQAVAAGLGISISTVRNHLKSVYRKVGVTSQVALVRKVLA